MKTCDVCIHADNHPLAPVLPLSSVVFLINKNYKHTQTHTGLATYRPCLRNTDTDGKIFQVSYDVIIKSDWNSAFMFLPFLHVFFSLLMISSLEETLSALVMGQVTFPGWSVFLNMERDMCVCVCLCVCVCVHECTHACVFLSRGEVQSSRLHFWCSVLAVD